MKNLLSASITVTNEKALTLPHTFSLVRAWRYLKEILIHLQYFYFRCLKSKILNTERFLFIVYGISFLFSLPQVSYST